MRHGHFHQHKFKRQKVICPLHEDCRENSNNHPCVHGVEHIKNIGFHDCLRGVECPACIETQEVVEEETFTEKEFEL